MSDHRDWSGYRDPELPPRRLTVVHPRSHRKVLEDPPPSALTAGLTIFGAALLLAALTTGVLVVASAAAAG